MLFSPESSRKSFTARYTPLMPFALWRITGRVESFETFHLKGFQSNFPFCCSIWFRVSPAPLTTHESPKVLLTFFLFFSSFVVFFALFSLINLLAFLMREKPIIKWKKKFSRAPLKVQSIFSLTTRRNPACSNGFMMNVRQNAFAWWFSGFLTLIALLIAKLNVEWKRISHEDVECCWRWKKMKIIRKLSSIKKCL